MKSQLINGMRNFVLGGGTGVALAIAGLNMWTGTTDLQAIKDAVTQFEAQSSFNANEIAHAYRVDVESANAEIGEYKDALAQANNNITSLITAYEKAQASAEQDLADLQAELASMESRLNEAYSADMNAVVEAANEQIDAANYEVAQARYEIQDIVDNSSLNVASEDFINNAGVPEVDMGGDKTVTDISGIVGETVTE